VAVWLRTGLQAAIYDGSPPAINDVQVPASGQTGQSAGMSAGASDALSTANLSWSFGDGSSAAGGSVSHTYSSPGNYTVTVTATDDAGNSTSVTRSIAIAAGGAFGSKPQPVVQSFSISPSRFAVAKGATAISAAHRKKPPRGAAFRYKLSEAGSVTILIERALPGRKSGRRCVAPSRRLRHAKRCIRYVLVGTLIRRARGGSNSTAFTGRIGKRALGLGSYRATIIEVTPGARKASLPRRVFFTIVRG
jgi:hypothetical protein